MLADRFRQPLCGRLGSASSLNHHLAHVHQSVQECAGCDDYTLCTELCPKLRGYAHSLSLLYYKFGGDVLPHVQVGNIFERLAPQQAELHSVALRAGAPHCRAFRAVEHAELYCRPVGDYSHIAAERVNLAHNLAFGNAADGRVAAHLCNLVHVYGHQARLCAEVGSGSCRLASCVSRTNDQNVVFKFHDTPLFIISSAKIALFFGTQKRWRPLVVANAFFTALFRPTIIFLTHIFVYSVCVATIRQRSHFCALYAFFEIF